MGSQGGNSNIFVDLQGFTNEHGSFILKHIALTANNGAVNLDVLVASNKPFNAIKCFKTRRTALWLTQNYHCIPWDAEGVPYRDMLTIIRTFDCSNTIVYVKGAEKKLWTQKIFKNASVVNIEDLDCPALHQLYANNNDEYVSATKNVKLLLSWFNK